MNDTSGPARRGEPFKLLLIVLCVWAALRLFSHDIIPTAQIYTPSLTHQFEAALRGKSRVQSPTLANSLSADFGEISGVSWKLSSSQIKNSIKSLNAELHKIYVSQPREERAALLAGRTRSKSDAPEQSLPRVSPKQKIGESLDDTVVQTSNALSGYAWLFARHGSGLRQARLGPIAPQFASAQYGASQAGAILNYRMSGDRKRHISTFFRMSSALSSSGQEELAIGIRAKPTGKVPVSFFTEQRFDAKNGHNRGTAFYIAGGTGPDLGLPEISLETYGQAGFLFASNDSYFFDASGTLQKQVAADGGSRMTAGAGIWASGQEGATRLDIGPRMKVHVPIGQTEFQMAIDWRERVGGNALPGSGASVTLSTAF